MLKNKSFLKIADFSKEEIAYLLDLAAELKKAKKTGQELKQLCGKNIALIFEKTSTRTRAAFEVAAYDQGAHVTYIGPGSSQIGDKESIADTAKVLGRMYDGIEYRGFDQRIVEELSTNAKVPVWNGLTNEAHPTQILADFLTIIEHKGSLDHISFAYFGDGRYNMANSLMIGAAIFGFDFRIAAPSGFFPEVELIEVAETLAEKSGAKLTFTTDPIEAATNCDVIYTDIWVSMGEAKEAWDKRVQQMLPYQVNKELVQYAKNDYIFMHCLPAFHDRNTVIGKEICEKYNLDGLEVTDEVFQSENSVVFDEAENRLHTIKAVMVATLGE